MISSENIKIHVHCPVCSKTGFIHVPKDPIDKNKKGLSTITIEQSICDHRFLVYIDKNYSVRASEKIDFVPVPAITFDIGHHESISFSESDSDLLGLNLYPLTLSYVLKCLFNKRDIMILLNKEKKFLDDLYLRFLNYIFEDTFETKFKVLAESEYNKKDPIDNFPIVINDVDILQDENNFLKNVDFGVEAELVKTLFETQFSMKSINDLKADIKNVYILSEAAVEFIQKKKNLNINGLIKTMKKRFKIEINVRYAEFLLEIVKNYYKVQVKDIYKNVEFLKFKKLSK
ncbi:MAG: hypothetical protein GF317_12405 [Candidatus Lokiarchaeota archaeon]|nr:hypothetical protein [Candidatus Lokiarchaeota archaeon]MBD3200450.1 hypothetical protein [Candidatus Lokiarchaeota archaeon]